MNQEQETKINEALESFLHRIKQIITDEGLSVVEVPSLTIRRQVNFDGVVTFSVKRGQ